MGLLTALGAYNGFAGGMWYMMGLLHSSGQYRIWTPKWAPR
jgi:hypothetical protein